MASFFNTNFNNREIVVVRMADTWNTKVDRLVEYLRASFPGNGSHTGINDYYARNQNGQLLNKQSKKINESLLLHKMGCVMQIAAERTHSSFQ